MSTAALLTAEVGVNYRLTEARWHQDVRHIALHGVAELSAQAEGRGPPEMPSFAAGDVAFVHPTNVSKTFTADDIDEFARRVARFTETAGG